MMQRAEAKSNVIFSSGIIVALGLALAGINMLVEYLGEDPNNFYIFVAKLVILGIIELFILILFGSVVEYFRKEPELLTLALGVLPVIIVAYKLNMFTNNVRTAATLGTFLGVALYVLASSE